MLVLFETSAGYAIFKLQDEKKLQQTENLYEDFETAEGASKVVKLKHFHKFEDTTEALSAATAAVEGKMSKVLKKMLKKLVVKEAHEKLAVADAKLGNAIKDKFSIPCVCNSSIQELMRCIRSQMDSLISGLQQKELAAMSLGLAHSLSRYKLKFSPDKVDTMIVQAVSLLDDLDKELNNYIMRSREWYGWHFPELGKIISDSLTFVKTVRALGVRTNAEKFDFSELMTDDLQEQVKEAAEISMGTEISDEDIENIMFLCDQVIEMSLYRTQLFEYLQNRMMAISPNLTVLVGELIGARLISHAGSLINLAKHPASTVQILGAEKALFRALKAKHDTPKYGIIYHAQLVAGSSAKLKGKISRMLAAKCALGCRLDALGDNVSQEMGIEHRAKLELRLKELEGGDSRRISGTGKQKASFDRYENKTEVRQYRSQLDSTLPIGSKKRQFEDDGSTPQAQKSKKMKVEEVETKTEAATPKKKKKVKVESQPDDEANTSLAGSSKKLKKAKAAAEEAAALDTTEAETPGPSAKKSKKKKRQSADVEATEAVETPEEVTVETPAKKKKKSKVVVDDSVAADSDATEKTPKKKKSKKE